MRPRTQAAFDQCVERGRVGTRLALDAEDHLFISAGVLIEAHQATAAHAADAADA